MYNFLLPNKGRNQESAIGCPIEREESRWLLALWSDRHVMEAGLLNMWL